MIGLRLDPMPTIAGKHTRSCGGYLTLTHYAVGLLDMSLSLTKVTWTDLTQPCWFFPQADRDTLNLAIWRDVASQHMCFSIKNQNGGTLCTGSVPECILRSNAY